MNKVADGVLGGWRVGADGSFHSGFPMTINATNVSGVLARSERANCLYPSAVYGERNGPAATGGGFLWFDPAAFSQPAAKTFGSCCTGTVRGPGLHVVDLSVTKT